VPEACGGVAFAREEKAVPMVHLDGKRVERNVTPRVAELAHREQGGVGEGGDYVHMASGKRKTG
jgi:hypothetical protein